MVNGSKGGGLLLSSVLLKSAAEGKPRRRRGVGRAVETRYWRYEAMGARRLVAVSRTLLWILAKELTAHQTLIDQVEVMLVEFQTVRKFPMR